MAPMWITLVHTQKKTTRRTIHLKIEVISPIFVTLHKQIYVVDFNLLQLVNVKNLWLIFMRIIEVDSLCM